MGIDSQFYYNRYRTENIEMKASAEDEKFSIEMFSFNKENGCSMIKLRLDLDGAVRLKSQLENFIQENSK